MSNRTSEANKAISEAWTSEKQLVLQGKGTRNWTPEQQRDILTKGKAYGEDGKAFEGHHMKSAEAYPECQGKAENIEFLSRNEHCSAHNGDFRNATNGYYNPHTGATKDFGEGEYEPCKAKKLSEPIAVQKEIKEVQQEEKTGEESQKSEVDDMDSSSTGKQSSVTEKLNSMGHKHTDAETKRNANPESTRETLQNMRNEQGNSENKGE
jgi:hypothetical protein